tara:strand:+ start:112 stop:309 length:198 start_codon:yes stop_codon:yes gene_type:complete
MIFNPFHIFKCNLLFFFVISLKKSLNRRKEFDQLNKNINYKYFDTIDGETCVPSKDIINNNLLGF